MTVVFQNLAEAVNIVLQGSRKACGHHIALFNNRLKASANIVTARVERLNVRSAAYRKHSAGHRAAFTILVSDTAGEKSCLAGAVIPEEPRPGNPTRVLR